ncbi:MAG: putative L-lactate dehydrogenase operon regulatory protein [Verrucomicrobiota bacterium]|jgi:DNA-binding GntR family transcriptional regulator
MPKSRRVFEPKIDRTPPNLQKLVRLIFSDAFLPGERLVERDLAAKLKLSRVPVREGLHKLVSKGILLKDEVNRGLRLRDYGPAEVAHLHEYREAIELAAARAACHQRAAADLARLEKICAAMDREAPDAPSPRWLELDWHFHQAIIEASGNERFVNDFDLLMIECNYVFYRLPATRITAKSSDDPLLATLVHGVVEAHRAIVRLVAARDTNGVVEAMRQHLAGLSNRVHRDVVKGQLERARAAGG